jgi:acyl-CoA thioesterase-1
MLPRGVAAVAVACAAVAVAGVVGGLWGRPGAAKPAPPAAGSAAGRHGHAASGGNRSQQAERYKERPLLAVVGASFSAGVGARNRRDAWPEDLARMLGWRLAVRADPGAGYVNPGERHAGPFARLAAGLHLARLHPAAVLIQGGHDDIGKPLALVSGRAGRLVRVIRREVPYARLGIISVFARATRRPSAAAWATDRAIVTAARQADPYIMVFDPLAGQWRFPRIRRGGLHPSPAGHRLLAGRLAAGLRSQAPLACPRAPSASTPCRVAAPGDGAHAEITAFTQPARSQPAHLTQIAYSQPARLPQTARQNSAGSHMSRTQR